MSSIYNNNFNILPLDMRREIFSLLPLRNLFTLPLVCQLFNEDMSNDFFKMRCLALFKALSSIPRFYEPLTFSVENPWKWICYALSGKKSNIGLYPVAKMLAKASLGRFRNLLLMLKQDLVHRLEKNREELRSICGDDYQDPNSKIQKAWKFLNENWTQEESRELEDLSAQLLPFQAEFYGLIDATNEETRNDFSLMREFLRKRRANPLIIRACEFAHKKHTASKEYLKLVRERDELDIDINKDTELLTHFSKVLDNPPIFEKYSIEIFYYILYFLPHLARLIPHFPTVDRLCHEIKLIANSDDKASITNIDQRIIRGLINSLPASISGRIWHLYFMKHGDSDQKMRWLEAYFIENPAQLMMLLNGEIDTAPELKVLISTLTSEYQRERLRPLFQLHKLKKELQETEEERISSSEVSETSINAIKELINSLPEDYTHRIWGTLYERCGNHARERQWSEHHFPEHIDALADIVAELSREARRHSGVTVNEVVYAFVSVFAFDTDFWQFFLEQAGIHSPVIEWSENHFLEHPHSLLDIISREFDLYFNPRDCRRYELNQNPAGKEDLLRAFVNGFLFNIAFHYPTENPICYE